MKILTLLVLGLLSLTASESLQKSLNEHNKLFYEQASAESIKAVEDDLRDRQQLLMRRNIPKVGDKAIDFTLTDIDGKKFKLSEALKHSPVVLFWYRGGWCPYCDLQLAFYQKYHQEIYQAGGTLIGIAPEKREMGEITRNAHEIEFKLLSDINNTVAKKYHIVYTVKSQLVSLMDDRFGLDDYYDHHKDELPLTIAYVVDQKGTIRYAFIDDDFRKRAEPSDIINTLENLKKGK
jgi:peroxiredoxin